MSTLPSLWPLIGIGIVVIGFALRANPLAVVVAAAFGSGLGAGLSVPEVVAALGKGIQIIPVRVQFCLTLENFARSSITVSNGLGDQIVDEFDASLK